MFGEILDPLWEALDAILGGFREVLGGPRGELLRGFRAFPEVPRELLDASRWVLGTSVFQGLA